MFKKVSIYVCVLMLLCICFSSIAFAGNGSDSVSDQNSETEPTVGQLSATPVEGTLEIVPSSTQNNVLRVSASDTTGLHAVMLTLIGDYNPIASVTEYRYPSGTGYQTRYQVDVTPDWSWIMTCALFIVVVFCVFRIIGGLFK